MQTRRRFLTVMARGGIFASLAVFSGVMIRRWSEAGECRKNFACGACNASNRCRLPEADNFRLEQAKSVNNSPKNGKSGK